MTNSPIKWWHVHVKIEWWHIHVQTAWWHVQITWWHVHVQTAYKNFHICFMVTCSCSDCMVTYSCFMVTCSCSDCIVTCSLCGATYIILYKGIKLHATVLHTHTQQSVTVHCFYILYLQGYRDWLLIGCCREVLVFFSYWRTCWYTMQLHHVLFSD